MLRDAFLDLLDRHPPVIGAQHVVQHLMRSLQRNRPGEQMRMGDEAVQRPFQLAHVRGDLLGEELHHPGRHGDAGARRLRLQDREPQFIGCRMHVGDHAAAEPRAQPVLDARQIGGRFVGRDDDLLARIDQRVEGMKEFFLRAVLADQELQIVDHQHIDAAQLVLELERRLPAQRVDEAVHEFFRRHIGDGDMPQP